jgi:hypothetical protein
MKTTLSTVILILLSAVFSMGEELPIDIQSLLNKRNQAVAKIDQTLVQELEKLKVKYTKAGELDSANATVVLIENYKAKEPDVGNLPVFPNEIFGKSFSWTANGRNDGYQLIILEGGKGTFSGKAITWKKINGRKLRLNFANGNPEIEWTDDGKSFVGTDSDRRSIVSGRLIE